MDDFNPDLVCWGANIVADKDFTDYKRLEEQKELHNIIFQGLKEFNPVCNNFISVTFQNKLFKARIIKDYNVFFPEGLNNEDIEYTR